MAARDSVTPACHKGIDWKKPIQTRDGRAVSLRYIKGHHAFCAAGNESFAVDFLNGKHLLSGAHSPYDVVNVEAPPAVDWEKPIQTRAGRKARVLCTDLKGKSPIVVAIEYPRQEVLYLAGEDGRVRPGSTGLNIVNTPPPPPPRHKHADVIIAWANGAAVQYRGQTSLEWQDTARPSFLPFYEYRVKP